MVNKSYWLSTQVCIHVTIGREIPKTKGIRNPKWLVKQRTLGIRNPHSKKLSKVLSNVWGCKK
jgi:hypothetical protein